MVLTAWRESRVPLTLWKSTECITSGNTIGNSVDSGCVAQEQGNILSSSRLQTDPSLIFKPNWWLLCSIREAVGFSGSVCYLALKLLQMPARAFWHTLSKAKRWLQTKLQELNRRKTVCKADSNTYYTLFHFKILEYSETRVAFMMRKLNVRRNK